jgi:hypothetical protein
MIPSYDLVLHVRGEGLLALGATVPRSRGWGRHHRSLAGHPGARRDNAPECGAGQPAR